MAHPYKTDAETSGLGGRNRELKPDPKITWRTPGWKPDPNEPVTQVTPRDAEAFCAWLTAPVARASSPSAPNALDKKDDEKKKREEKNDGLEARATVIYRLPTEAEWLHACRAGSIYKHVVGPDVQDLADYAWTAEFLDPNPQASPLHLVGQKKPNPFGLHDTLGNVWEYTRDYLSPALVPYLTTNDPMSFGPGTSLGGSSMHQIQQVIHPDWSHFGNSTLQGTFGFRVLKQLDSEPLPGPLDRPLVLRPGQPMSIHALVPRPEKIPGLQSWSVELAGPHAIAGSLSIAASQKGDLIASGSHFGKISLWDRDGKYQRALLGHEGRIASLDFSPDGRWLASCEWTHGLQGTTGDTARVWNVETGELRTVIPIPGYECHRIQFSPNGERLAVSLRWGESAFVVIDLSTGRSFPAPSARDGNGLAWSPDNTELACSHGDGRLRVWDAKTLKILRDVEAPLSSALEWSPDGQRLALRNSAGNVAIHDAKTLKITKTFGTTVSISSHAIAWLPDSQRLVVAQEGMTAGIFHATTGETLANLGVLPDWFYALTLRSNGTEVVGQSFNRLFFYDASTGQKLREGPERGGIHLGGHSVLSHDGREVFSQTGGTVFVSDALTGERTRQFTIASDQVAPTPSPDGTLLALWQIYGVPNLPCVDAQTGATRFDLSHDKGNVTRLAWSPDGKWLATGATDKLVRVWNVATGKIEHELAGHTGTIWSLAWSPDGTRLASAAEDKTVRIWNPLAGKLVATYDQFPEAMNLNFGPNCDLVAWTTDSRRLWIALNQNMVPLDVETGAFGPLENISNGGFPTFLNTSPDGQRLLAREHYGWTFVRGRDAQDRRLLGQHLGQTAQWHPDSRRFLGWELGYGTVGFDVETNRRLGMLFPWLTGDHWLCLGPTGHYRGSPGVEDQIVYVAMLPDGSQRTYTPAEFAKQFAWKNDPEKAELLGK